MTTTIDAGSSPTEMREMGFVQERSSSRTFSGEQIGLPIWHRDGIRWFEAEPPTLWHTHWAQTCGRLSGTYIERCPCGAIGEGAGVWIRLDPPRRPMSTTWWSRVIRAAKRERFIPA